MSTSGGDIEFTFRGNAAQLMGELRKIDGGIKDTAAKAAPSVGKVKTAFDKTSGSAVTTSEAIGKVGQSSAKAAGALSMVSAAGGESARALADVADVGEIATDAVTALGARSPVAAAALVALAAAVAPLAGHFLVLQREAEEAAAQLAFVRAHADDLVPALDAADAATRRLAAANGTLSEESAAIAAAHAEGERATRDYAASLDAERQAANDAALAADRWIGRLEVLPGFLATAVDYYGGFTSAKVESLRVLDALTEKENEYGVTVQGATDTNIAAIKAEERKKAAREAGEKATRAAEDAERAYSEALQASNDLASKNADTYFGVLDSLRAAEDKALDARLGGIAKIEAARDAELEDLRRRYEEGLALTAENNSAREELDRQYAASKAAIEGESARQSAILVEAMNSDAAKAQADALQRQQAQQAAYNEALASSIGGTFAALADLAAAYGADTEAMQKAQALTSIGISAAQGIMKAFADFGWPAGIAPAAFVAIESGIQAAAVSKAHQGGVAPDEMRTLLREEAVLNTQATRALGEQGVMALNGGGSAGGTTSISLRVGRAVQREVIRAGLQPGGPVDRAISRASTRNGLDTGFSGRVALP